MDRVDRTARGKQLLAADWNKSLLLSVGLTGQTLRFAFESAVGIPMSRLQLLAYVYGAGEVSQADLQRQLGVDGATVTRQVKQMEAGGLLRRWADPKDNRFTLVDLTEAGEKMVEALVQRGQEFEQLAIGNIGQDELAAVLNVLAQVRKNLHGGSAGTNCAPEHEGDLKE